MRNVLAGFFVGAALLSVGQSQAGSREHPTSHARAAFASLQSLIGEWEAPLPDNQVMRNVFRPIAFGTALAHEEWKNGEQLTATVFYVVGSELHAAHFCGMGNQLHFVAAPSANPSTLHFALRDATNLDTHPLHFRSTTWQLIDADHHVQDWEAASPGKPPRVVRMEFKRSAAAPIVTDPEAAVRAQVRALNQGDGAALLALFSPDAKVFEAPQRPDRLVGELSDTMGTHEQRKAFSDRLLSQPPPHVALHDVVSAGDLAIAKLRFNASQSQTRSGYVLAVYRVHGGLIQDLWHISRADRESADARRAAENVVRRLAEANNGGDLEAFLALFSPQAKNFRNTGEPHMIGDKPSVSMVDERTRREAYSRMFANGAPAQVETLGTVALGGMIAAREVARLPDGKVLDELSVYSIENAVIVRDWFIFYEARE